MPRLRFTLEQAETEARRLAESYVTSLSDADGYVFRRANPDRRAGKSPSTKLPVIWQVMFERDSGDGAVIDGGELVVMVNVETREAALPAISARSGIR